MSVKDNYALFDIKVRQTNKNRYDLFNKVFIKRSKNIDDPILCQRLMDDWVKFFNDKHLWITIDQEPEKVTYEYLPLNLKKANKRWENEMVLKDPIEGLWEMDGYRVAILPDQKNAYSFNGIIVSADNTIFKRGMLKMRLKKLSNGYDVDFFLRDSTLLKTKMDFTSDHTLLDENGIAWRRKSVPKGHPIPPSLQELSSLDPDKPNFRWLDDQTSIITLPSCAPRYSKIVDSLMFANKEGLANCKLMIVDVRDNGGGSDRTYKALLPYILTEPLKLPKVGYYTSKENKKMFKEIGIFQHLDWQNDTVSSRLITLRPPTEKENLSFQSYPINVAVLTNNATASSGETFVMKSKQSSRVTTFGEVTAGCVDGYNGNIIDLNGAKLRYPTSVRTLDVIHSAIDPFGLLPDVRFPSQGDDLINFVVEYYSAE